MTAGCELPIAPAVFAGIQRGEGIMPDFALYNLTADIPGHCTGSTVSDKTLRSHGYRLPEHD